MGGRRYTTTMTAFRALYQLLADSELDALAPATVVWGAPGQAEQAAERLIVVGAVRPAEQEPAAVGQRRRDERYEIEVAVDYAWRAQQHAEVNAAASDAVRAIEEAVNGDPTLDGALYADGWADIAAIEVMAPVQLESGAFNSVVAVRVGCRARI